MKNKSYAGALRDIRQKFYIDRDFSLIKNLQ